MTDTAGRHLFQWHDLHCFGTSVHPGHNRHSFLSGIDVTTQEGTQHGDAFEKPVEILIREIDDPPALPELSTRVGTNATKLKKGFRQVFGTTAYALVRRERVERARIMLSQGRFNITQIAQA